MPRIGGIVAQMFDLTPDDVCYLPMPLFHSNALMTAWGPALAAGATVALPSGGHFSASGFLPDVRRFGVTYFNYVGKPLAYMLATPERPDDADNPLPRAFGNEGASATSNASPSASTVSSPTPTARPRAGRRLAHAGHAARGLGTRAEGTMIVDRGLGRGVPAGPVRRPGPAGNAEEAIGELVSQGGGAGFEGYWRNEEAEAARLRRGWYWTGDLAYRDAAGFFYFAGRDHDWLRVDGENFGAAPVERILERDPEIVLAAVYAVPDPVVGDQVMAAIQRRADAGPFDPAAFARFLSGQEDLGTKWAPRFVRVSGALPVTATNKVLKRVLRAERWRGADPIWWRPAPDAPYRPLADEDARRLDEAIAERVL